MCTVLHWNHSPSPHSIGGMVRWILGLGILATGFGFAVDIVWGHGVAEWKRAGHCHAIMLLLAVLMLPVYFTLWCFILHTLLKPLGWWVLVRAFRC